MNSFRIDDRRGAALVFTLLIGIAVAAMALGALMVSSGATLSTRFTAREAAMQAAANGGLEIIRDSLNHGNFDTLLPMNGYTTLVSNEAIVDAYGVTMPRTTRSLYVGRTGGRTGGAATAGQYGSNFSSGLSVIRDQRGAVAARRMLMTQESWSKFAVAINNWSASSMYGCGESINGPFHSNHQLHLQGSCGGSIKFSGPASVVSTVTNEASATFAMGLKKNAAPIDWPTIAKLELMKQFAIDGDAAGGDYDLTAPNTATTAEQRNQPRLRIEFLTIDANNNGTIEWDEGYMRVFRAKSGHDSLRAYVSGRRWPVTSSGATYTSDPNMVSRNCGGRVRIGGTYKWYTARAIYDSALAHNSWDPDDAEDAVRWLLSTGNTGTRRSPIENYGVSEVRCFLGGDPNLYHSTYGTQGVNPLLAPAMTPDSVSTDTTGHEMGWWIKRRTGPHASVAARTDADYLIPLGKNPNYKGIIFVTGDVAISGTLRGRTSIFATGSVTLADDLTYYTPPGTKCDSEGDILGVIAGIDVVIADNSVQTPFRVNNRLYGGFDSDTPKEENYNLFFMSVTGNFYTSGLTYLGGTKPDRPYALNTGTIHSSATNEKCAGGPAGCIRITGGLAMGRVDKYTYDASYGYAEAHTYDKCGASNPPPYFPTTGRFIENRYYEVDPVWLSDKGIANYFADIRAQ